MVSEWLGGGAGLHRASQRSQASHLPCQHTGRGCWKTCAPHCHTPGILL